MLRSVHLIALAEVDELRAQFLSERLSVDLFAVHRGAEANGLKAQWMSQPSDTASTCLQSCLQGIELARTRGSQLAKRISRDLQTAVAAFSVEPDPSAIVFERGHLVALRTTDVTLARNGQVEPAMPVALDPTADVLACPGNPTMRAIDAVLAAVVAIEDATGLAEAIVHHDARHAAPLVTQAEVDAGVAINAPAANAERQLR